MFLTHDRVIEIAGRLTDDQIVRILECQAQEEDLLAAMSWVEADDTIERETHHQPGGKVARLYEILMAARPDEEDAQRRTSPE